MDERDSSPQTTLVILLGASEWPEFSDFHGSQAFANVASDFRDYLLNPQHFGLPEENFLDLFDTDQSPDKIDRGIRQFLDHQTSAMKQAGKKPGDLLLYFVGHGGFVGRDSEYYLAVRCTSSENPDVSGIRIGSLARTLTNKARYLRRLIILDCCYAAAAFTAFQAEGPAQEAVRQAVDVFKEKAKTVGKGTSLLCSSGKKVTSLLTPDGSYTMFSKALLHVLATGNPHQQDKRYLSLREVADLTEEVLDELLDEKAPHPELHSPDQVDGNVADVPFFPNPAVKAVETSPPQHNGKVLPASEERWLPSVAPPMEPSSPPPTIPAPSEAGSVPGLESPHQGISRRTMVLGLGMAGLVAVAGGGIAWLAFSQEQHSPVVSDQTPTPIPPDTLLYTYHGHSSSKKGVNAAVWSHDGKRVASGSDDKTVQVWNAADGGNVYTYRGHSNGVNAVAWSPDGKRLASASDDNTARVWDATTGKTIASSSGDKTVQIWDASTSNLLSTYTGHLLTVKHAAWSPDGKRIASASYDKTVKVWDATTGNNETTYPNHRDAVLDVAWSPNGQYIASASADLTMQVWNAVTGEILHIYRGHTFGVNAVAWSPDGKFLVTASDDTSVKIWQAP